MNSTMRLILWLIALILAVIIGIEIVYKRGECCNCTTVVETPCPSDNTKTCKTEQKYKEGCCKCSFIKEHMGIDIYSWTFKFRK